MGPMVPPSDNAKSPRRVRRVGGGVKFAQPDFVKVMSICLRENKQDVAVPDM